MSSNNRPVEQSKDSKERALQNNPCGICRALGMPVCKGHGGGGGGSTPGSSKDDVASGPKESVLHASHLFNPVLSTDISALLPQNGDWSSSDVLESVFHFESPDALLSLHLDMERGLISFHGNKNISTEQYVLLNEFFSAIEVELGVFKKELAEEGNNPDLIDQLTVERQYNSLTLKFPSPRFYDGFVKRLVDKNLLPVESTPQQEKTIETSRTILSEEEVEQPYRPTAPSPFDINGPKLKG